MEKCHLKGSGIKISPVDWLVSIFIEILFTE